LRFPIGSSSYRSIRITGRITTVAPPDWAAIDLEPRVVGPAAGKLITVPISLPPPLPAPRRRSVLPDLRGARLTLC
jgi:hypothetical protein